MNAHACKYPISSSGSTIRFVYMWKRAEVKGLWSVSGLGAARVKEDDLIQLISSNTETDRRADGITDFISPINSVITDLMAHKLLSIIDGKHIQSSKWGFFSVLELVYFTVFQGEDKISRPHTANTSSSAVCAVSTFETVSWGLTQTL